MFHTNSYIPSYTDLSNKVIKYYLLVELFNEQKHRNMVDVIMCNVHDERDAWMMLMDLSDIKRELLNKLEEDAEKQVDTSLPMKYITEMMKQRYIALKVVQLLKKIPLLVSLMSLEYKIHLDYLIKKQLNIL